MTHLVAGWIAIALCATFTFAASPATAQSLDEAQEQEVMGWERPYTHEDGISFEGGEIALEPRSGGFNTLSSTTTFSRGASYVSTRHPHDHHLRYFGRAYAAGNLYQGQYVISAGFRYYRNSGFNSGWKTSYAVQSSNCRWSPGPLVEYSAFDSIVGGDENVTRFTYRFGLAPTNLC